ncbi:DAO-domain-containing protein [Meredithblackwellia eburnea MCA 4105]
MSARKGLPSSLGKLYHIIPSRLPLPPTPTPSKNPPECLWDNEFARPDWLSRGTTEASGQLKGQVDILIIGTGITGVSCLRRLLDGLEAGSTVRVAEARRFCGGATGRNGGHLASYPLVYFKALSSSYETFGALETLELEDRSVATILSKIESWGEGDSVADLVRGGSVILFEDEAGESKCRAELEVARQAGLRERVDTLTWLSSQELKSRFNVSAHSGLLIPAFTLFPLKFVARLFEECLSVAKESGITIEWETENAVTSLEEGTDNRVENWVARFASGHSISCSQVVHTTNAYVSSLLPHLASTIIPTRAQVLHLVPSAQATLHGTSFSPPQARGYLFQRPDGSVIIGGGRHAATDGQRYEFGEANDGEVNPIVSEEIENVWKTSWGGEVEKKREWTGIMAYTSTGIPFVGQVRDKNGKLVRGQWISAAYSGHGMSRAPACGEALATMVLHGMKTGLVDALKGWEKPAWFPRYYFYDSKREELSYLK